MKKIAIVGSSGAGKTTLAQKLSSTLNINAIYLDRLFWQRDWEKIPQDERIVILQHIIQEKQWIIEGTYINNLNKLHQIEAADTLIFEAADTIIFLDIHPFLCLLRIIRRSLAYRGHFRRRDMPEGCADTLNMRRILRVLFFPLQERIKLEKNLRKFSNEKVIRFHSAKEVLAFLDQSAPYTQEYRQPVKKRFVLAALGRPYMILLCLLVTAIILLGK